MSVHSACLKVMSDTEKVLNLIIHNNIEGEGYTTHKKVAYVRQQVGHTNIRMIVDHYYRYVPAPGDGAKLENAWNSTRILPESGESESEVFEKTLK